MKLFGKSSRLFAAAALACVLALGLTSVNASGATKRKGKRSAPTALCNPISTDPAIPSFPTNDAWRSVRAYKFPFRGHTSKGPGTVLWKTVSSALRRAQYPAPNLPSCRIGGRKTEDRTSRKASQYFENLVPIDGQRSYPIVDTFGRPITTIHWEEDSLFSRHPERWGWYVGAKWAGHDALRAFEVQGNACKLGLATQTQFVGNPPVPTEVPVWARDPNYVMVAFNPVLGATNRKYHPNQTGQLRVRGFIDRRAIPGWANFRASRYDFGCGESALSPLQPAQPLDVFKFSSGYGPGRTYMHGQYFGETASQLNLLPGETRVHNNMPYSSYNAKPQFGNAMYAMINTTGVSGGGMVRGIVRAGLDSFTLHDQMYYCDPNYTLRNMLLKRYGKRVSKWNYFELATFSRRNTPTVRWVYGQVEPNAATVPPEAAAAAANPASAKLFAWIPLACDK